MARRSCARIPGLSATDTHCHLERFRDPGAIANRARQAGVRVIAVTSRPSDFRRLFPVWGRRRGVRLALGLHPLEVGRLDLARELSLFERYAAHTSFVGEIGLDLSKEGRPTEELQVAAFTAVLNISRVPEKVLTVHSRKASAEVVAKLRDARASRVVLHWFSGSVGDLEVALDAGFYLSVNPAMTTTVSGRRVIAQLPHDRVLVESDGPYARIAGRILEPRDVWLAIDFLARQWQAGRDEVADRLAANLRSLLGDLEGVADRS